MSEPATDLGICSDIEALDSILSVTGLRVIDVGCGDGDFSRLLAERGATVLGIEPGRVQAEPESDRGAGRIELRPGQAQQLPVDDQSADCVVFKYSLHHVPLADMHAALLEAIRVLKPDGTLYIAEPVPQGSFHQLVRSFHDEAPVQTAALQALNEVVAPRFTQQHETVYQTQRRYRDFEEFVENMMSKGYNHYRREQVEAEEVLAIFRELQDDDGCNIAHPVRVNCYRDPR